jgi:hypothetical protein
VSDEATYEHHFVTNDGPIFNMIEDESGDIFWGYGHVPPGEFLAEVNRWAIHVGAVDSDHVMPDHKVEHLWARMDDQHGERFALVDKSWLGTKEAADDIFPVTRLML